MNDRGDFGDRELGDPELIERLRSWGAADARASQPSTYEFHGRIAPIKAHRRLTKALPLVAAVAVLLIITATVLISLDRPPEPSSIGANPPPVATSADSTRAARSTAPPSTSRPSAPVVAGGPATCGAVLDRPAPPGLQVSLATDASGNMRVTLVNSTRQAVTFDPVWINTVVVDESGRVLALGGDQTLQLALRELATGSTWSRVVPAPTTPCRDEKASATTSPAAHSAILAVVHLTAPANEWVVSAPLDTQTTSTR